MSRGEQHLDYFSAMVTMLKHSVVCLLLLCAAFCNPENTSEELQNSSSPNNHQYLPQEDDDLPKVVVPISYKLQLQPFPYEGTFQGQVEITVGCVESTDILILHAHRDLDVVLADTAIRSVGEWINIDNSEQVSDEAEQHIVKISKVRRYLYMDWYEIILENELLEGMTYVLKLKFFGNLTTGDLGPFYRIIYNDKETGESRWLVATDLKAQNSRRVFPCFDELNHKATFQISVYRLANSKAFSTTSCESTEVLDGSEWEIDNFNTTPPMVPESVAIIVFDSSSLVAVTPVKMWKGAVVHGYTQPHLVDEFESNLMYQFVRMLQVTEHYTNVPFPLPDLFLIAAPNYTDVSNYWGLIIFSEDEVRSRMMKHDLMHAITTQWVGHLVTPNSRSGIGFSNGLAQYLVHIGLMNIDVNPQYENFISWGPAFSHHIYFKYSEIHGRNNQHFTEIRTTRLCKMLNFTLTEKTFRGGFYNFLQDRAYLTYTENQFFKILDQQAWLDLSLPLSSSTQDLAKSWIEKDHFPVVTVIRNYINNTATIEQHAFIREWPYQTEETIDSLWWVPIIYMSFDSLKMDHQFLLMWMREEKQINITQLPDIETFIILNPDDIGLFLVNYDHTNWELLSQYLDKAPLDEQKPLIPRKTRCKLLSDAIYLALSGELDFPTALDMTLFVQHEKDMSVWDTMLDLYDVVYFELLDGTHDYAIIDKFGAFVAYLLTPAYESLTHDTLEDPGKKRIYEKLLMFLDHVGYKPALEASKSQLNMETIYNNYSDIRSESIFSQMCSIYYWYDEEWDIAMENVLNFTDEAQQKHLISRLVSCTRKPDKLDRIFTTAFLSDYVQLDKADMDCILHCIEDYYAFMRFILSHWEQIKERYETKPELWNAILQAATQNFKSNYGFNMVSELYHSHKDDLGSARRIVEHSMYTVSEKMNGQFKYVRHMESWLNKHLPLLYNQDMPSSQFMSSYVVY